MNGPINRTAYAFLVLAFSVLATAACEKGAVEPEQEPLAKAAVLPTASASIDEVESPEIIYSCYTEKSGEMYRIRAPGVLDQCEKDKDTEFSWNQQGPQGPPGPPGISGYEIAERVGEITYQNETGWLRADCPPGKSVLGGGFNFVGPNGQSPIPSIDVFESAPWGTASWDVLFKNSNTSLNFVRPRIYVICAHVSP